jgi:(2S)-methylsuccinyl-CoA dehydrogenase
VPTKPQGNDKAESADQKWKVRIEGTPTLIREGDSDNAVWVTQEGQLIHGGWGYGEEYAISRYVVDALVLPIFEGVKPILELKVIARTLLA